MVAAFPLGVCSVRLHAECFVSAAAAAPAAAAAAAAAAAVAAAAVFCCCCQRRRSYSAILFGLWVQFVSSRGFRFSCLVAAPGFCSSCASCCFDLQAQSLVVPACSLSCPAAAHFALRVRRVVVQCFLNCGCSVRLRAGCFVSAAAAVAAAAAAAAAAAVAAAAVFVVVLSKTSFLQCNPFRPVGAVSLVARFFSLSCGCTRSCSSCASCCFGLQVQGLVFAPDGLSCPAAACFVLRVHRFVAQCFLSCGCSLFSLWLRLVLSRGRRVSRRAQSSLVVWRTCFLPRTS